MSDIEKVRAVAAAINGDREIQLRWEGAGNCMHPQAILLTLQSDLVDGNPVPYKATINIYEEEASANGIAAKRAMGVVMENEASTQSYSLHFGRDVKRAHVDPTHDAAQMQADIMFVRNIMLVTDEGGSATGDKAGLLALHNTAIRARSNSLNNSGQLRVGMSGRPGLHRKAKVAERDAKKVGALFHGFDQLNTSALESDLLGEDSNRLGGTDFDEAHVMKNTGVDLGSKKTYYLTFIKPAIGAVAPVMAQPVAGAWGAKSFADVVKGDRL